MRGSSDRDERGRLQEGSCGLALSVTFRTGGTLPGRRTRRPYTQRGTGRVIRERRACREVPAAGSRPRPTNQRKEHIFMVCVSFGRRGGLQAARAAMPCRERSDDAAAFPFPVGRGRTPPWGFCLARNIPGWGNTPGRRTRRPYTQRGLARQIQRPRLPQRAAAGSRPRPTNKNHKLQRFVRPPRVRSQYSPMLAPGRPVHSSAR